MPAAPVSAGELEHRVTIEQRSVTRGTLGEEVVAWATLATVWARVTDQVTTSKGGDEAVAADMRVLTRRSLVRIRFRADVSTDMRVQWPARGRTFQITGLSEIGRRELLELTCEQYSV